MPQICCWASVPWLKGLGFLAKYWSSWWDSLDANKSPLSIPLLWQTFWNTFGESFHSDGSLLFWDCQSAPIFKEFGRYFVVIVIWCFKTYCQISLLIFSNICFPVSPFLQGRVGQWCCLFENELLLKICDCWRSKVLILLLSVPTHLCVTTVPPLTIAPLLTSLDILHPFPLRLHLFVSGLDCETESSNDHCKFSNFVSNTAVLPWSFCLESLFCNMVPVFLMLAFVVVVTWNFFVLEVLLE